MLLDVYLQVEKIKMKQLNKNKVCDLLHIYNLLILSFLQPFRKNTSTYLATRLKITGTLYISNFIFRGHLFHL